MEIPCEVIAQYKCNSILTANEKPLYSSLVQYPKRAKYLHRHLIPCIIWPLVSNAFPSKSEQKTYIQY